MEDLCIKYSIGFYPSLYAIPAGISMINNRTILGNSGFSIKDVENVMQHSSGDASINTKTRREVKDVEENDASRTTDDNETTSDGKTRNVADDDKKKDGDNGKAQHNGKVIEQDADEDDGKADTESENRNYDGNTDGDDNQNDRDGKDNANKDDESDYGTASFDEEFEKFKSSGRNTESIPMIASSGIAGAERAKSFPKNMDRWKEILKQRLVESKHKWLKQKGAKSGSQTQDNLQTTAVDTDGATDVMLAHRKGTKEYTQRQIDLLNMIEKLKSSARRKQRENPQEIANQLSEGQLPFKKQVTAMKIVERLPILKHTVRMSHEEELILDASLSFLTGLKAGVYKSDGPLSPKQQQALKSWLDLLHISLPPEWALQEVIGDLITNFEEISNSRKEFKDVLNQHMLPRHKWSNSCSRENGFSCGFWKLLHTMTVGIAEYRGGQDLIASGSVMPATRVFSPLDAADTVREYMAHFFPCTECSKHFIGQYDQCEMNRRCDRLTSSPSMSSDADWKELSTWLWEVHNDVSIRLINEKHESKRWRRQKSLPETDQIKAIWPAITDCPRCLSEDGSFDENIIFLHLEQTYW